MLMQGTNVTLNFTITSAPDIPYNIEDTTVQIIIVKPDSKLMYSKAAEVIDPIKGTARVFLAQEDLAEGGTYEYQVVITFLDKTVSKSAISSFYVSDSISPSLEV